MKYARHSPSERECHGLNLSSVPYAQRRSIVGPLMASLINHFECDDFDRAAVDVGETVVTLVIGKLLSSLQSWAPREKVKIWIGFENSAGKNAEVIAPHETGLPISWTALLRGTLARRPHAGHRPDALPVCPG